MNKTICSIALIIIFQLGCNLDSLVRAKDPEAETELNRGYMRSLQGAIGLLNSARGNLQDMISVMALDVGLLTDELTIRPDNHSDHLNSARPLADVRYEQVQIEGVSGNTIQVTGLIFPAYHQAYKTIISSSLSRHLLRSLDDPSVNYAIAAAYAVEAYALIMMAENMCSGIPFFDVFMDGHVTYRDDLSTEEVFRLAVAKFDSALQLSHDSLRYVTLTRIGKARALMGLGDYQGANEAVKDIHITDKFEVRYAEVHTPNMPATGTPADAFWTWVPASASAASKFRSVEIVNNEGINGLIWYSDAKKMDPRLPVTTEIANGITQFPATVRQNKFVKGAVVFQLAKWAEAKLIEAEYKLKLNDQNWIDPLNEARRSIGLADTISPQATNEKVDLLFRERAYWFYGEAVRLADFRRLIRQYDRSQATVYPAGSYTRLRGYSHYGNAVVYVPHISEYMFNGLYGGCFHENP